MTSFVQIYKRLNNWCESPAMLPYRRFWLLSVCFHLFILIAFLISSHSIQDVTEFFKKLYLLILLIPLYPFIGFLLYFVILFVMAIGRGDILPEYYHIYNVIINFCSFLPLGFYLFVLYFRKSKSMKHLIYITPAIISVLWMIGAFVALRFME